MAPFDNSTSAEQVSSEVDTAESSGALWMFLALLPTFVTILYFGFIASNRYVSEAQFVIRTAAKPLSTEGAWGVALENVGFVAVER